MTRINYPFAAATVQNLDSSLNLLATIQNTKTILGISMLEEDASLALTAGSDLLPGAEVLFNVLDGSDGYSVDMTTSGSLLHGTDTSVGEGLTIKLEYNGSKFVVISQNETS